MMVNVIDWLRFNKFPYWKIFKDSSADVPIVRFFPLEEKDKERPISDGVEALENALAVLAPGKYFIEAYPKLTDMRNKTSDWFQHGETAAPAVGQEPKQDPQDVAEMVRRGVAEELSRREHESHLKALEAELAAYRQKDSAYQEAVSGAIGQVMPFVTNYGEQFICGIINALNGHRGEMVSPRGIGNVNNLKRIAKMETREVNGDAQRLEKVIGELRQIEPEKWLDLLEALVKIHDTDPGTYGMARNFLLK